MVHKSTWQGAAYPLCSNEDFLTSPQSGLTQACLSSEFSHEHVYRAVLAYIKQWIPRQRVGMLAGSSIHADRAFLAEAMPDIVDWLHYRYALLIIHLLVSDCFEGWLVSVGNPVSLNWFDVCYRCFLSEGNKASQLVPINYEPSLRNLSADGIQRRNYPFPNTRATIGMFFVTHHPQVR